MSDQYAYAGYDVGGAFGTGFPFAYTFATPVAPNDKAIPLGKFGKWWWLVKGWKLTTDAGTFTDAMGATYSAFPISIPYIGIATRELDLIKANVFPIAAVDYPGNNIQILMFFTDNLVTKNDLFYPDLSNVQLTIKVPAGGTTELTINLDPNSPGPASGSMPGSMDGIDMTFYYHIASPGTSFSPGSFTLVQDTFWSYGGIYNTSTGEVNPGQNPFSR